MTTRNLTRNAVIAAIYAAIALALPATALANYRLATTLYALAAWNPALVSGLALGNAIAGIPQGPVDIIMGGIVGLLTAWTCSRVGEKWAPLAVLVVPTLLVPMWLGVLFHAPYWIVVMSVGKGQAASAILAWLLLRTKRLRRFVDAG